MITTKIKKSKKVAIFGHQSPDGDCLGSIYAISFLCKSYGKEVDAFIDDEISDKYKFLDIPNLNKLEFDETKYDLMISVDVASGRLLGKYKDSFENFNNTIVIDHHSNRDLKGTENIIIIRPSCCEIVYELIKKAKKKFTSAVATMLYLGIADDTGCFLHDNTTAQTHFVAGDLIKNGADFKLINYNVFKLQSLKNFEMTSALNSKIIRDNGLTYVVVTNEFLTKNSYSSHDMGDYVNKLLNLEGTKIAFVMTEKQQGVYSISFRCLAGYDVSLIAQKFGGGGHIQASGGQIKGKLKASMEAVVNECKLALKDGEKRV